MILARSPRCISEAAWSRRVVVVALQYGKGMAPSRPITPCQMLMTAKSARQKTQDRGHGRCHEVGVMIVCSRGWSRWFAPSARLLATDSVVDPSAQCGMFHGEAGRAAPHLNTVLSLQTTPRRYRRAHPAQAQHNCVLLSAQSFVMQMRLILAV